MDKIKFGVLGVSNHFLKRIILPLQKASHCEIYAVASRSAEKAENFAREYGVQRYYDSYDELLNDRDLDAVYIPLPNHMHFEWIKNALKKGKHVLCEKPMTLTEDESRMCFSLAKENGLLLMEAFMYRFHPQWIHARDVVRTKQIGQIKHINTVFAYNNPNPSNIRNIKDYGGGALMDIGCYALSSASYILNKSPERLCASMKLHDEFKTDYLTTVMLDYGDTVVNFYVSTLSEPSQRVQIIGSAGEIEIEIPFNAYVDTKSKIVISTSQGQREVFFDSCDQYGLMFDAFAQQLHNGNNKLICEEDTILNMHLIETVKKSAVSNAWVTL